MTPRQKLHHNKELAAFFLRRAIRAQMEVYRFLAQLQEISGESDDILDYIEQMAADFREEKQADNLPTEKCIRVIEGTLRHPDQEPVRI